MTMQTTADVVVIGAGVIGCSTAYHLAQMGITDVALVEMDQVGSGTTSKSASMLSLQFHPDELCIRMAKHSYKRYMGFEEELGTPIDFDNMGWVNLATLETVDYLRESAEMLQSFDIATELLEPEEIKRRYPEINTEDILLGSWGPEDGSVDPHMIMWGYVRRASDMGVRLYQGVRATGIRVRNGRVEGVETEQGFVSTRVVVNAGGPWAIEIGGWVGVDIPIENRARTVIVTEPLPDLPLGRPFFEDLTAEWYYRPEGRGILMGMGKEPVDRLQVQPTYDMLDKMISVASHRAPVLETASVLTSWAGVRPLTSDDRPILGPVESPEGFVLNCGWGGMGIIQSPIAGQLVAEYVRNGHTPTMDIGPLSIERFDGMQQSRN